MNENFNRFRQEVLGMDVALKRQLVQDSRVIISEFDQHSSLNSAYPRLGYMVESMGIEITQIALVEMYNRSKSIGYIVNVFTADDDSNSDYVNFIDRRITWTETKYPHGYTSPNSGIFWNDLHKLFREEARSFDFELVDECQGMSIREVLMHNIEVKIEKKPKHLKAWN